MQGMCIMLCTIQAGKALAATEGVKRATADFVRFHCPLLAAVKTCCIENTANDYEDSKILNHFHPSEENHP